MASLSPRPSSFYRMGDASQCRPSITKLVHTSDKHPRHFLDSMCLLYRRHELCDVTLCVGSVRIQAHRVVLSACSPYFCAMFTGEWPTSVCHALLMPSRDDSHCLYCETRRKVRMVCLAVVSLRCPHAA